MNSSQAQARQRALLILQVQAGQITATAAAQQLGLSRKSYYQWEKRALAALLQAMVQQAPGRPQKESDPEKETLRQQVEQLREQVSQLTRVMELRQSLQQLRAAPPDSKKNSRSCAPSSNKPPPLAPNPN
jgi:transposase